jgi:hypothetical protein
MSVITHTLMQAMSCTYHLLHAYVRDKVVHERRGEEAHVSHPTYTYASYVMYLPATPRVRMGQGRT